MKLSEVSEVKVVDLVLWSNNPRYMDEIFDEKEIIKALFTKDNTTLEKQYLLAKDIIENGLVQADLPIVVPIENEDKYTVYEGNRRIAAIKSIINPSLLDFDKSTMKKFENLKEKYKEKLYEVSSLKVLITTQSEALKQIDKLHNTKGKKGLSRETWGSKEQDYFDNVVDNKMENKKKKPAYYITTVHKNIFDHYINEKLKYTSINRLLNFRLFSDISGIKNYEILDDKQIELIKYYFDKALYVEKTEDTKISRFKVATLRKYIENDLREKYDEILTRDDAFIIEVETFIQVDQSDLIEINPTIKEKSSGTIIKDPDFEISYYNEHGENLKEIDTNIIGNYNFKIIYNDAFKDGKIIVSRPKNPTIKLKKYSIELSHGETYDLRRNISENSENLDVEFVEIKSSKKGKEAILINDVFSDKNTLGDYKIEYYYEDKKTTAPSKVILAITVRKEERNLFNTLDSVFSEKEVFDFYVDNTVTDLIQQASKVSFEDFYYLVGSSFRTIIELLLIKYINGRESLSLGGSLEANLSTVINDIKHRFSGNGNDGSILCEQYRLSYDKYKSNIDDFDQESIKKLCKRLHFYGHTAGTMLTKDDIHDFGRTQVTYLIITISMFLR